MTLSPYTPGSAPLKLPGRADKLAEFREIGQRINGRQQFIPRIHINHGPRGVGKTSLLAEARRILSNYSIRTVLVTATRDEDLVQSILGEFKYVIGAGGRLRKDAAALIDSVSVTLGAPGVVSLAVSASPKQAAESSAAKQFQRALTTTLNVITSEGDAGLVILVDEIQEADDASLRTIAYAWQEMNPLSPDSPDQPRSAFLAVGLPGTPTKVTKAVTFSERFQFQTLPGLTSAGSREAFEQTAKDVRILWEQEALDFAVEESAGYPYKVQLIGDFAWKAAVRRVGGDGLQFGDVIVLADVREALPRVDEAMETLFRARWNGATGKQREMLAALARLGGVDVKRGVLAEALSSPTKAISVPRQRLLDRGLIDANKHGHLSFTVPGFTQFVLDQVADE